MKEFEVKLLIEFTGHNVETCTISPSEFLHCNTEDEVREDIWDMVYDRAEANYGDVEIDDIYDNELTILNENGFWEEWRRLKNEDN